MKLIKPLILFITTLTVGYYLLFFILFNIDYKKKPILLIFDNKIPLKKSILYRTLNEIENQSNFDFIFFGSSHCYRGLNPDNFKQEGLKTYNLGGSSQTPANSLPLLNQYIDKTEKIILEVYPVAFGINPTEAYYDLLTASNSPPLLFKTAIKCELAKALNLLALKPLLNVELKKDTLKKCFYRNGFTTVTDSAINRKIEKEKTVTLNKKWLNKQFSYLQDIADVCKQKNKPLVLVYAPVPKTLKIVNESIYLQKIYAFIQKNQEVHFFNYGRTHTLSDKYNFYDNDHLNASGVKLFNTQFIIDLKKQRVF